MFLRALAVLIATLNECDFLGEDSSDRKSDLDLEFGLTLDLDLIAKCMVICVHRVNGTLYSKLRHRHFNFTVNAW